MKNLGYITRTLTGMSYLKMIHKIIAQFLKMISYIYLKGRQIALMC